MTAQLDYLVKLGVDAVWLSPIYSSPMADFGYDITDYCGSIRCSALWRTSIRCWPAPIAAGLSDRRFVANHTSDRHPWFRAVPRLTHQSAARLVRLGRPEDGRRPPNNWLSSLRRCRAGVDVGRRSQAITTCTSYASSSLT